MRIGIFLVFVAVPLIELALLIKLGQVIGVWATVGIVILTAFIGTAVLRHQGLQTMIRLSEAMSRGEPPIQPVVDGAFLILAGAFLLTPGILTDSIGFALLVPAVRRQLARWGLRHLVRRGTVTVKTYTSGTRTDFGGEEPHSNRQDGAGSGTVIDGEFERVDEQDKSKPGRK